MNVTQLDRAPIASPVFTGNPQAPTPTVGDNTTSISTTAFVTTAVTNAIAGVNPAVAVQYATAAVLPNSPTYANGVAGIGATLTANANNIALVVDGSTPALLERVLVKNQASALQNGVYYVSQLATAILPWILVRSLDFDQPSDINNTGSIPVVGGSTLGTTSWVVTSQITAVGTDALTFTQFSYAPSAIALLASPTFTGVPAAPTAGAGTNTTQLATTAFVKNALTSTTYTPAWTSTGTAPAIGNGTIKGQYIQTGDVVQFTLALICGSTTTFGTGSYRFSLPVAMNTTNVIPIFDVQFFSNATGFYYSGTSVFVTTTTVTCVISGSGSAFSSSVPATWQAASTTFLTISGTYFV